MACMTPVDAKAMVLDKIAENSPQPTELLRLLKEELSYREIQRALRMLLDSGEVALTPERRLTARNRAAVA